MLLDADWQSVRKISIYSSGPCYLKSSNEFKTFEETSHTSQQQFKLHTNTYCRQGNGKMVNCIRESVSRRPLQNCDVKFCNDVQTHSHRIRI